MKSKIISFDSFQLKFIAVIAMIIDHIAWGFVSFNSVAGQIMHIIGRITAPIMCYFIAEGYFYTHNIKRYIGRIFIFALISQIPYMLFNDISLRNMQLNVMFNLLSGLIILIVIDKAENNFLKYSLCVLCFLLSLLCDWSFIVPGWILCFGMFREDEGKRNISFIAVCSFYVLMQIESPLFSLGTLLALPLLYMYNGKKGGNKYTQRIYYIIYPLHMMILYLIKIL